ncbi:apolipoprotein C-III isoform X2 [Gopherus evgoodei]|uniref:apolipoprotein C-III isoform X2 n=1 Tax=Gopherus evgoodei TaxID=1825980 RepID=UPI0011CF127C|nr:apolipoprotein C-III isoform X2 [Gopherus evgoodei]
MKVMGLQELITSVRGSEPEKLPHSTERLQRVKPEKLPRFTKRLQSKKVSHKCNPPPRSGQATPLTFAQTSPGGRFLGRYKSVKPGL